MYQFFLCVDGIAGTTVVQGKVAIALDVAAEME
jgi:hypothetical protein